MTYFLNLSEADLLAFARRFSGGLNDIAAALDFDSDLAEQIEAAVEKLEKVLDEHRTTHAQAKSVTQKKNKIVREVKSLLKRSNRQVRSKSAASEAQLRLLGLQPYNRTRATPALPETTPHLMTEIKKSRRHILRVRDGENVSKARPPGVLGAEIWLRVGDAGALDEDNYRYLGLATSGSFTFEHDAADIGRQAFYIARWVNRKGERGGWSDTANATIAA